MLRKLLFVLIVPVLSANTLVQLLASLTVLMLALLAHSRLPYTRSLNNATEGILQVSSIIILATGALFTYASLTTGPTIFALLVVVLSFVVAIVASVTEYILKKLANDFQFSSMVEEDDEDLLENEGPCKAVFKHCSPFKWNKARAVIPLDDTAIIKAKQAGEEVSSKWLI